MLPISLGYNVTGCTKSMEVMAEAIRYGLLGIPPASVSAATSCPSGECTWQAYDTLAVCSLCENVTAKYPQGQSGGTTPFHENICIALSLYEAPSTTRFFNAYISKIDPVGSTQLQQQTSEVYDCSLSWCIRSFSSAI